MRTTILAILIVLIIAGGAYLWHDRSMVAKVTPTPTATPTATPIPTPFTSSKVMIDSPLPGSMVTSPLMVTGQARGTWYFEASFPVKLQDANGKVIASTPAQAQSDWMTTDFVPFKATLTFTKPATPTGFLVLQKDNPSGLPQYEESVKIPVVFY